MYQTKWIESQVRPEPLTWASNTISWEDGWMEMSGRDRSGDNGERNRSTKLISVAVMKAGLLPTRESRVGIKEKETTKMNSAPLDVSTLSCIIWGSEVAPEATRGTGGAI